MKPKINAYNKKSNDRIVLGIVGAGIALMLFTGLSLLSFLGAF